VYGYRLTVFGLKKEQKNGIIPDTFSINAVKNMFLEIKSFLNDELGCIKREM
jgi:hypothetical protein